MTQKNEGGGGLNHCTFITTTRHIKCTSTCMHARLFGLISECHISSTCCTDYRWSYNALHNFEISILLVIDSNLPSVLHRFQVTADYMSNFG